MTIVEETLRAQTQAVEAAARRALALPRPPEHGRVVLFGLGSSHHVARLAAWDVGGVACQPQEVGARVLPRKDDLAVGFSHRGTNKLTLAALARFRAAGAAAVLVAAEGRGGDIASGPLERCEPHTVAVTTAACAAETWLLGKDAWPKLPEGGLPERAGPPPTILLGEHAGYWLAREAALKLIEMARVAPRVYGSEEFFHGPSWALKPDDVIWHVKGPDDPRAGEIQASRVFEFQSGPGGWAPALVRLQWAALAAALARGEDPDDPMRASTARKSR